MSSSERHEETRSFAKTSKKLLAAGSSASFVTLLFNFSDHTKVRLQVQNNNNKKLYNSFVDAWIKIGKQEGIGVLFGRGLTASLIREMSYSSVRIGMYDTIKAILPKTKSGDSSLINKILAGATTGAIGSSFVNPCDLIKVRQQAVFPGEKMPYKNFFTAVRDIVKQDGFRGLYQGVGPTIVRAAVVTASQMGAYDHSKQHFLNNGWDDNFKLHLMSALIASVNMAFWSSPVDVIKSRYMNDLSASNRLYKSGFDCFMKTIKNEGILALYKGVMPNYFRLAGHCILALPIYEQFRMFLGLTTV
eukprot:gene5495-9312_t